MRVGPEAGKLINENLLNFGFGDGQYYPAMTAFVLSLTALAFPEDLGFVLSDTAWNFLARCWVLDDNSEYQVAIQEYVRESLRFKYHTRD